MRTSRKQQRGAAMAEAAIVMTVIVATWFGMATAYANGAAKIGAQWNARTSVMYHASNECKKNMPGGGAVGKEGGGQIDQHSGDSDADRVNSGAPNAAGSQSARSSFFIASGSGSMTRSGARLSGDIVATKSSESWAVCNEGKYAGDLFGLLAYGADFFKDLLPGPIKAIF